jgi:hypothetical protein
MRTAMKRGLITAVVAGAFGILPASAGATLVASSSPASMTSGQVAYSSLWSCQSSQLTLENPVSLPAGQGGTFDVTDATYADCEYLGNAMTYTTDSFPWTLTFTDGSPDQVVLSGISFTMSVNAFTCSYAGSITGHWLSDTTATFSGASGLSKTSGGLLCPNAWTFSGDYVLDNGDTIVVS